MPNKFHDCIGLYLGQHDKRFNRYKKLIEIGQLINALLTVKKLDLFVTISVTTVVRTTSLYFKVGLSCTNLICIIWR